MRDRAVAIPGTAPMGPDFTLTKWYMDVVDEHQNAYIGYWVALTWRKLQLQGDHHLLRTARDGVTTHGGLSALPPPTCESDTQIRWRSDEYTGLWSAAADPIRATLFQSERGAIRWECLMPKARGEIDLPQLSIRGWGYLERLEMTLPVWDLPFNRLYWGRCHTANHYLVWIQWSGATSQSLAWHNGLCLSDLTITDRLIETSECRLTIDHRVPLRQGQLISTIFRPLGAVTKLLPRPAFMAHERKWLGHGTLHVEAGSEPATILYEEVTW